MLRIRTELTGFTGGPGLSTMYYECATENAAAAIRCQQYVHNWFGAVAGQLLCNSVTWKVKPEVDLLDPANGEVSNVFTDGTAHTATGGGGTSYAPLATAALFRFMTSTWANGRNLKGRSYISPMASAAVGTNGELHATVKTAVEADLVTWQQGMTEGDIPVVWSRPITADPEALPPIEGRAGSTGNINAITIRSKLAVLTSRRD